MVSHSKSGHRYNVPRLTPRPVTCDPGASLLREPPRWAGWRSNLRQEITARAEREGAAELDWYMTKCKTGDQRTGFEEAQDALSFFLFSIRSRSREVWGKRKTQRRPAGAPTCALHLISYRRLTDECRLNEMEKKGRREFLLFLLIISSYLLWV